MSKKILLLALLFFINSCASNPPVEITLYYEAKASKAYADVLAELKVAIAENNFRITGHSRVGKVIRKRGTADFPDYDTIQFCNLTHAKELLLISPHAVRHMPCNVVVYDYEDNVIVKIRLLPTDTENPELNAYSKEMNLKLKEIVDFAVEE